MRNVCCCLLLSAAAAAGCVHLPFGAPPHKLPEPEAKRPPAGPVTAEQITEANAHEKAQELRNELDRELRGERDGKDQEKDKLKEREKKPEADSSTGKVGKLRKK